MSVLAHGRRSPRRLETTEDHRTAAVGGSSATRGWVFGASRRGRLLPSGPPARLGGRDPAAHDHVWCRVSFAVTTHPPRLEDEEAPVRRWVRDHGLLLANAGLFVVFFVGMVLAGVRAYNGDQSAHHQAAVSLWGYLHTGDFVEATFENWESRVPADGHVRRAHRVPVPARLVGVEADRPAGAAGRGPAGRGQARGRAVAGAPRRAGAARSTRTRWPGCSSSCSPLRIALHARRRRPRLQRRAARSWRVGRCRPGSTCGPRSSGSSRSRTGSREFLAVAVIVGASVYLRQRGSAESKPVAEPHHATGA